MGPLSLGNKLFLIEINCTCECVIVLSPFRKNFVLKILHFERTNNYLEMKQKNQLLLSTALLSVHLLHL